MSERGNPEAGRAGAARRPVTQALYLARPDWRSRELVDDVNVTALYAAHGPSAVCLLSYDVCELFRCEARRLSEIVGRALGIEPERVHAYATHTHSSSIGAAQHDMAYLAARSVEAALEAKQSAVPVASLEFRRADTGRAFNINRRTQPGPLGTWCLMQAEGCTDDGAAIDGTGWVRRKLRQYGARESEVDAVSGPYAATRPNDPWLDLLLFAGENGCVAGLVRFTAHAVVCSAGYWRPNIGRGFPGVLCDRLTVAFGCPILFVQGPCADHRPRHRDVGLAERDRIGGGLAELLLAPDCRSLSMPFNGLEHRSAVVQAPLRPDVPDTATEAAARREAYRTNAAELGSGQLACRKALAEAAAFHDHCAEVLSGRSYLTPGEAAARTAPLRLSAIRFGPVSLLNFPGELPSTAARGLTQLQEGPAIVTSYADGVTGYLMPPEDVAEGGYESTWAIFDPACAAGLRGRMLELAAGLARP